MAQKTIKMQLSSSEDFWKAMKWYNKGSEFAPVSIDREKYTMDFIVLDHEEDLQVAADIEEELQDEFNMTGIDFHHND